MLSIITILPKLPPLASHSSLSDRYFLVLVVDNWSWAKFSKRFQNALENGRQHFPGCGLSLSVLFWRIRYINAFKYGRWHRSRRCLCQLFLSGGGDASNLSNIEVTLGPETGCACGFCCRGGAGESNLVSMLELAVVVQWLDAGCAPPFCCFGGGAASKLPNVKNNTCFCCYGGMFTSLKIAEFCLSFGYAGSECCLSFG